VYVQPKDLEGTTIYALSEEERDEVLDFVRGQYAEDSYGRIHPVRFTTEVLLKSALRSAELAHMAEDWLVAEGGRTAIKVRPRDCSCSYCETHSRRRVARNDGEPDPGDPGFEEVAAEALDRMWHAKTDAGDGRLVTVYDDGLPHLVARYFRQHGDAVVHPNTVYERVRKVQDAFGFEPSLTPHRCRHSAATHLHRQGVELEDIADELGHASTETARIYVQEPYAERADRIAERMA
jgi:integrase